MSLRRGDTIGKFLEPDIKERHRIEMFLEVKVSIDRTKEGE